MEAPKKTNDRKFIGKKPGRLHIVGIVIQQHRGESILTAFG